MYNIMIESIFIAFIIGGIMGAITALHLAAPKKVGISENTQERKHTN